MGDATRGSPGPLQAPIIPPLRSYHKPPYVKNLSFCVRASATTYYNLVIVEPASSEIPLPRAARLFSCLSRRLWAGLSVEMVRSVYCVWPIPCEYSSIVAQSGVIEDVSWDVVCFYLPSFEQN